MLYWFLWGVDQIYLRLAFRFRVIGAENVPKTGGVILCANHISANDPLPICAPVRRLIHYMAKKELYTGPVVNWFLNDFQAFPVDRQKTDLKAIKTAIKLLKQGEVICIFAQGTRVAEGDAKAAKGGVALIAAQSGAPVVPVHIIGRYKFRHPLTVVFGKPIDMSAYKGQRLTTEILTGLADNIMDQVMALGED